jgi:23S rRNA pseudouridine1911/1915/1917 synthase
VYLAVVNGVPEPPAGTWRDWVRWDDRACQLQAVPRSVRGAVEAACVYDVRERFAEAALIEVRLITGRQNQIRAQAMMHGHPLVGEQKYAARGEPGRIAFARQALHAHQLAFAHPLSGRPVSFESPLPRDLTRLLARLREGR